MSCDRSSFPYPFDRGWSLPAAVQLATLLEASAPKLGNVHPTASFSDMRFTHFLGSAVAVGSVYSAGTSGTSGTPSTLGSLGELVLRSVQATRQAVGCNTNLGSLLLFAPLARGWSLSADEYGALPNRVACVLHALTAADGRDVYAAIRAAQPGGLGQRQQDDVAGSPPSDLRSAMAQVAAVDAVARQYINDFADVFSRLVPWLSEELVRTGEPLQAICRVQMRWLAHEPDGLIVRKSGMAVAAEVQRRAAAIVARGLAADGNWLDSTAVSELENFLRSDQRQRNPGTTADLLAASCMALLLE